GGVAGEHAVLGGRRKLARDDLAEPLLVLAQVEHAHADEPGRDDEGHEDRRDDARDQQLGADAAARHRRSSSAVRSRSTSTPSGGTCTPRENATWRFTEMVQCAGARAGGSVAPSSSHASITAPRSSPSCVGVVWIAASAPAWTHDSEKPITGCRARKL